MNGACLRVPSIKCRTIRFFGSVVASWQKMASISRQLTGGIVSSIRIMRRPFRPPIQPGITGWSHWRRSVLWVIRNTASGLRGQSQGRCYSAFDFELADSVLTMAIDRAWLDAQFAGDLLGAEMSVDKAQALPLSLCQPLKHIRHPRNSHTTKHNGRAFPQALNSGKGDCAQAILAVGRARLLADKPRVIPQG